MVFIFNVIIKPSLISFNKNPFDTATDFHLYYYLLYFREFQSDSKHLNRIVLKIIHHFYLIFGKYGV